MLPGTSYNRQAEASGTRDEVKGFTHSGRQAGKDPRSRVSQRGHQGKDDSPVTEDRADLDILEPENDEEQNDMLSGKKPEQENDETIPVDDNEAGGKKKKRKHRSCRGKGAAATRWSPRNTQKTEGTTGRRAPRI
jgi:hypothetical protein